MSIFTKKYDIKKEPLRIEFDSNLKKYVFYYGNELLSYDSLSKKIKKILDEKNRMLYSNPTLLEKEIRKKRISLRRDKLKNMGYICDSFEYLGSINGTMSKEMEEYLNKLTSLENVLLGIHRVGSSVTSEDIADILKNGLVMTGHLGGAVGSKMELKNNVGYYADNKTIIKELMYADMYKNSKGSILIKIPDSDLTGNIYVHDANGTIRLNPEYILGYVPVLSNHHIETIIKKCNSINVESPIIDFNKKNIQNDICYEEETSHVRR